jgi:hypothetical protein
MYIFEEMNIVKAFLVVHTTNATHWLMLMISQVLAAVSYPTAQDVLP